MTPILMFVLAVVVGCLIARVSFARPVGKVVKAELRKVKAETPAVPEPEPRVPRDLDRPYPRPKGGRRKLDKTCPVCGTGDGTGSLGGKVLGWPAHASCAEWLGEQWRPARPAPPPFSPDKQLIGYIEQGQKPAVVKQGATYTTYVGAGEAVASFTYGAGGGGGAGGSTMNFTSSVAIGANPDGSFPIATADDLGHVQEMVRNGMVSLDEVRQRLDRKKAAPVFPEYCTCGWSTTIGTAEENRRALDAHRTSGECPHSVKRRADLRDLEGR
jgi:hypothetical protein